MPWPYHSLSEAKVLQQQRSEAYWALNGSPSFYQLFQEIIFLIFQAFCSSKSLRQKEKWLSQMLPAIHLNSSACLWWIYKVGQRQYSCASWGNPAKDMGDGTIQHKKADRKILQKLETISLLQLVAKTKGHAALSFSCCHTLSDSLADPLFNHCPLPVQPAAYSQELRSQRLLLPSLII